MDYQEPIKAPKYIGWASSVNDNSGITFNFYSLYVKVWSKDKRLGVIHKLYDFENEREKTFIYFQNIAKMLDLLSKYNYPLDIKFKNLENPTSDLVFLYEGREVDLQFIEKLYDELKKEPSLYYSNGQNKNQEEFLLDGYRVRFIARRKEK